MEPPEFTIVGSGLASTLMACYLAKAGRHVDLYEKRPDPRIHGQDRGRSINLALSVRGIHALQAAGLADEVLKSSILMRGRMIHAVSGALTLQPYGKDDTEALHSVSRAGLNLTLVEAAARFDTVRLFFSSRCTGLDVPTGTLEFLDEATHTPFRVSTRVVFGADCAYLVVRPLFH